MATERLKRAIRLWTPPILLTAARAVVKRATGYRFLKAPRLEYAPDGWDTRLPEAANGWNAPEVSEAEEAKWKAFCENAAGAGPLGFSHEASDLTVVRNPGFHNIHMSFAYVLARAAHRRDRMSVLDWGGSLGHYEVIARAVLPEVDVDFHCKDVPRLVERGQALNPGVRWHTDDRCLDRRYDLVMINGSLQYMRDWRAFLPRAAGAVDEAGYLFLTRVPVVEGASFVAIQRAHGAVMCCQQFNRRELLDVVASTGLRLVREFVVGDRPPILNAPEQCELKGWLFRNDRGL